MFLYACPEVPVDTVRVFFYFRFSSRKFQIQQKLVLQTSTHLALKLICFCNTVKKLSDFINFPTTMFLVSEKIFALHHF